MLDDITLDYITTLPVTVAIEVTGKLERAAEVTNELIGVVEIKLMTEVNDAFIEIIGVAEIIIELIILVDTSYELMEITDDSLVATVITLAVEPD